MLVNMVCVLDEMVNFFLIVLICMVLFVVNYWCDFSVGMCMVLDVVIGCVSIWFISRVGLVKMVLGLVVMLILVSVSWF